MASVLTLDYLKTEGALAERRAFTHFLSRVPDAPAAAGDEAVETPVSQAPLDP
jgi:hypothetical protein